MYSQMSVTASHSLSRSDFDAIHRRQGTGDRNAGGPAQRRAETDYPLAGRTTENEPNAVGPECDEAETLTHAVGEGERDARPRH